MERTIFVAEPVSMSAKVKVKQRRTTQACDYCHKRSVKCRTGATDPSCLTCKAFDQPCTYERKPRRRGPRSRIGHSVAAAASGIGQPLDDKRRRGADAFPPTCTLQPISPPSSGSATYLEETRQPRWTAPVIAGQATIVDLVDIYFEIVYPVFPFFHQPTFVRRISRADYATSSALFAVTMAMCALASGRIRDGSITNPRWRLETLRDPGPDVFYTEAKRHLVQATPVAYLDILRAHAVLAIAAIQNGKIRDVHEHLYAYHGLVAMDALHDESNWPVGITAIEREERRRLFWSIYTLDIYTSVIWGGIVRSREQQSNVAYPTEVDDERIQDSGIPDAENAAPDFDGSNGQVLAPKSSCWLSGWNFVTDIYRVLEHALTRFQHRNNRPSRKSLLLDEGLCDESSNLVGGSVENDLFQLYLDLPSCFKETPPVTYNAKKDIFGYQATNITGSLQLLRIVLFAAGGESIKERCQIVQEVVDSFASVPTAYLLAISTPLLHHLGGIGSFLGPALKEPLSEAQYNRVRSLMLSLAQLLENLERGKNTADASGRLRFQIGRIDEYMATKRPNLLTSFSDGREQAAISLKPPVEPLGRLFHQAGGDDEYSQGLFRLPPELLGGFNWNAPLEQPWN